MIDCFSRRLAGWAIADHMRTELIADALTAARDTRGCLAGAVFHPDYGSAVHVEGLRPALREPGGDPVHGRCGHQRRQRPAKSFNASLKRETLQGAHAWPD